jgi:hypothetical protein
MGSEQPLTMQTSIPFVGVEPTIPALETSKIVHALDRATTALMSGKGSEKFCLYSRGGLRAMELTATEFGNGCARCNK